VVYSKNPSLISLYERETLRQAQGEREKGWGLYDLTSLYFPSPYTERGKGETGFQPEFKLSAVNMLE